MESNNPCARVLPAGRDQVRLNYGSDGPVIVGMIDTNDYMGGAVGVVRVM